MKPAVRFEHVSKRYRLGGTRASLLATVSRSLKRMIPDRPRTPAEEQEVLWALRDVSFELPRGEALGVLGPNGAGKTTILKLLANITRPTSGLVEANGRMSALIELGAGFHPDLTGRENVYLNGAILGLSRGDVRRRFDEIVAFAELERFIDTPVKRYSSGMYVRLGFAVAACIQPDILLVDEVLAVGDASFRLRCMKRIQELREGGTSIVFVSHNLYMVQAVCTSALYLENGQVQCQGDTSEAIDVYERAIHEKRARAADTSGQRQQVSFAAPLEIVRVSVQGVDSHESGVDEGTTGPHLTSDRPAEVRVEYVAHEPLKSANAVIRIVRSDGATCCMMRTRLDGFELSRLKGEGTLSVFLEPLQLVGGTYFVEARMTDHSDSLIMTSVQSRWFHVNGRALSYEEKSGVFEPRTRWSHDRRSPVAAVSSRKDTEISLV